MVRCVHGLGGPLQGRRTGGRGWQWVTSVPAAMVASARSSSAAVDGRTCQGRTSRPSPPRGRVEWCGVAEAAGEALTGAARAAGAPRPRMPRFCDASAGALSESRGRAPGATLHRRVASSTSSVAPRDLPPRSDGVARAHPQPLPAPAHTDVLVMCRLTSPTLRPFRSPTRRSPSPSSTWCSRRPTTSSSRRARTRVRRRGLPRCADRILPRCSA